MLSFITETHDPHYMLPEIVKALAKYEGKLSIRIVLTSSARQFLNGQSTEQPTVSSLSHLPNGRICLLSHIVNGMSDNLLTSVIRAWDTDATIDGRKKVIAVAPAMNSAMWRHPVTAKQIRVLAEDWGIKEPATADGETSAMDTDQPSGWFQVIKPITKTLACGDTGDGAMASVDTIRAAIETGLGLE
ncbi:flavoprotein [Lasiosphaeria hispida]|uniref:Flavoprotein n=1 Tax=Lasiosphaeria hispida TaxID=260671 RepID=A0AAJ0MHL5_9PEZI|nr:flavoprotein [Lasiosphaeria hispida]